MFSCAFAGNTQAAFVSAGYASNSQVNLIRSETGDGCSSGNIRFVLIYAHGRLPVTRARVRARAGVPFSIRGFARTASSCVRNDTFSCRFAGLMSHVWIHLFRVLFLRSSLRWPFFWPPNTCPWARGPASACAFARMRQPSSRAPC